MNAFSILFANTRENNEIVELTKLRTPASIPFGGRYRLVDFVLSSLVKANVRDVGIVTNNKYASLVDHVGVGRDWDLARKNGGLKVLPPYRNGIVSDHDNVFRALYDIKGYIQDMLQEYCIISGTNMVCNIDFEDMLLAHQRSGADITVLYRNTPAQKDDLEIRCDESGRINYALLNTSDTDEIKPVVMRVSIMKKDFLLALIDTAVTNGWENFAVDVVAKQRDNMKIYAYEHRGYCSVINNLEEFYRANMELLKPEVKKEIFKSDYSILTRIKDSVPTVYGEDNKVKNSFVADGCYIDGVVENSIIFRDVKIAKGAYVKDSIIMQNTEIGPGAQLNCVITDKDVKIGENVTLTGNPKAPFVIAKGKNV